ncbi:MAG: DUF4129 domain-containing protein [Gemmatimonadaceae bacterium]
MLLAQLATRQLPASVVHDTVAAIARGIDYRRSLRQSLLDRFFLWLSEAIAHLVRFLRHSPMSRPFGYAILGLIVLGVAARLLIAAQARDDARGPLRRRTRASSTEDPFVVAERLAAEGRFEEAAHAVYHGVLLALARKERLRLDPSKTSGDYARELRARGAASYQPFRVFARRFDVAVFGHGGCDARLIDDLRALAQPISAGARAA